MLKLDRNSSNYNKIIQSSYGRYLSKIGQIHAIYVTDNNGRAVLNHNMHIMMKILQQMLPMYLAILDYLT